MIIHYIICTIEITKSVFIADLFPTTTAWISNKNGLKKGQLKLGHFASGKSKIYVNIDKKPNDNYMFAISEKKIVH